MSDTLQEFLAKAAEKTAGDLETALLRLPEDKRSWAPAETARTAMNMAAECAILNGYTAVVIETKNWPTDQFEGYMQELEAVVGDWGKLSDLLKTNTARVAAAIRTVPDSDINVEIPTQFGPMTWSQIISYPYWNMAYHEGQINYIASILGCL